MARLTISDKPLSPVIAAIFSSSRLSPVREPVVGSESDLDVRRLGAGPKVRRTRRLLWILTGGGQRAKFGLGAPRRSVDREFQELTPPAFDW